MNKGCIFALANSDISSRQAFKVYKIVARSGSSVG
jgi:hypothetical protein